MEKNNRKFGRRRSDVDMLHAAKQIAQCEKALNNQVDKLFEAMGLTREEVDGRTRKV